MLPRELNLPRAILALELFFPACRQRPQTTSRHSLTTNIVLDMIQDDFVTTLDSDDDVENVPTTLLLSKDKGKRKAVDDGGIALDPGFTFEMTNDVYMDILDDEEGLKGLLKGSKRVRYLLCLVRCSTKQRCLGSSLRGRHYREAETEQFNEKETK